MTSARHRRTVSRRRGGIQLPNESTLSRRTRAPHPLLQDGFRPFFLAGAIWAAAALWLWLGTLAGAVRLPAAFDPLAWHQHEMLFGYVAAVIAGFALTAVPNWTGRLPLRAWPLAGLFALWLAGRIAVATGAWLGSWLALVVDVAFLALLAALVAREIVSGRNWRNLPIGTLLGLLALANLASHLAPALEVGSGSFGHRLGIGVVLLLIGLVGGRVVPSFTRNWLAKQGEASLPAAFGSFDKAALLALGGALIGWILAAEAALAGVLLVLAGAIHAIRLARWRGWRTAAEPLVLILHLGYAWLPVGLILLGLSSLARGPDLAALHALTAGAIGTMTLAIMTRASLGHTGRALTADRATRLIYAAVILGALLRVISPLFPAYQAMLWLSGGLWSTGFLLFALMYGPMLMRARADVGRSR